MGCGSGYFTIPISHKVKKVYGIDIQKEMLDYLERKMQKQRINNVETLLSRENEIPLKVESIDLLLTVNTLHEFRNRKKMIKQIRRVLKPQGKAVIVDFKKEDANFGPPIRIRISKGETILLIQEQCFEVSEEHSLAYHYLVIFLKTR